MQAAYNLQQMGDSRLNLSRPKRGEKRTMYIGRENCATASLTTFTIPACEQLYTAISLDIPTGI
jgi:hypothetical protein